MEVSCRPRSRSSSPPRPAPPVRRQASCPEAPKPQEAGARGRRAQGAPKSPNKGRAGGTASRRAEDRAPLLLVQPAEAPPAGASGRVRLPVPELGVSEEEGRGGLTVPQRQVPAASAGAPLPGPAATVAPGSVAEPLLLLEAPGRRKPAPHPVLQRPPEAGARPRALRSAFGKGPREASQWKQELKDVQTQPLHQDFWVKRVGGGKASHRAFRLDSGLPVAAGLLPSSLLSAASQASLRDYGCALWQGLPEVKGKGLPDTLTPEQRCLQEAMFEVVTSETTYLRSLLVGVLHFQNSPALRATLAPPELHRLFSNFSQVKDVSEKFLLELERHLDQDVFLPGLGGIILAHCPAFRRVYLPYVTNQMYQEQLMQELVRANGPFRQALRGLEEQPICRRQPLRSFLALPFQRITRLKLLLENILKWSPAPPEVASSISTALQAVGEIVWECNENAGRMKHVEELVLLRKQLDFSRVQAFPLVSWGRRLVHQGDLWEVRSDRGARVTLKALRLHLFSDLLLVSRPKEERRFAVMDYAWTHHVKAKLLEGKPWGPPAWTFCLSIAQNHAGGSTQLLLKAASEGQRQEWVSLLAKQPPGTTEGGAPREVGLGTASP